MTQETFPHRLKQLGAQSSLWIRLFWSAAVCALAAVVCYAFFDSMVGHYFQRFYGDPRLEPLRYISRIGQSEWFLVPSFLLFLFWRSRRRDWSNRALFVFLSVGLTGLAALGLKAFFGRARPNLLPEGIQGFHWFEWSSGLQSFPSGHTITLFAAATALGFFWPGKRWLWFATALALSLSRIVIGRHYPSDIVAGAWIGYAGTCLIAAWQPGLLARDSSPND